MGESNNTLWTNDNLYILNGMNSESVDLIYLDPPFNSKRTYSAPIGSKAAGASFKDMWTWQDVDDAYLERMVTDYPALTQYIASIGVVHSKAMMSYLTFMTQRLIEMRRVLKPTGSIYLHCDPTASHYIKVAMDRIFGKNNFRNEIVWCYTGPGSPKMKQFNRKHDIIFWYSKSARWTFNGDTVRLPHKDGAPHTGGYEITGEIAAEYDKKGEIPETWWNIAIAARSKSEYVGYPTQKPLALLRRIIKASSNKGDIVLDPFCGCATTCVAAQQLNRRWIGIDIAENSHKLVAERLKGDAGIFTDFVHRKDVPQRTDVKIEEPSPHVKKQLYKEQKGKCNGCFAEMQIQHLEIDHITPKSKGGGDYKANYQLLCGHCNRVKGNKPMEYLRAKIAKREEALKKISFGE